MKTQFVVCLKNDGYPASLEKRKLYQIVPDSQAATHDLLRVIDESGEDYLYPAGYFAPIEVPAIFLDALMADSYQLPPVSH
jgi:hypothetical protein